MRSEIKKYKGLSRIVLLVISFISIYFLGLFLKIDFSDEFSIQPDFEFDYRYEQFFPEGDEDLEYFNEYRVKYQSDNDFILISLVNKAGVFEKEFLKRVDSLTKDLEAMDHVREVLSPTNLTYQKMDPLNGLVSKNYLNLEGNLKKDSINVFQHKMLVKSFFSETYPAVAIIVNTDDFLPRKKSNPMLKTLYELKDKYTFDEYHMSGRVIAQSYFINRMGEELGIFMTASTLLIILFLWFSFRSWWGIVIPIFVVLMSILWTMAFMKLSGKPFDMLTTLMPTIIFVVGMSDVVHIISKYLEELRKGKDKLSSLKIAFKEVGVATFLTSFTTAVGFYTLMFANIAPIRDFGWFIGAGVFISYVLAFTLLPAVLIFVNIPKIATKASYSRRWEKILRAMFLWVMRKRKLIIWGSVSLTILSLVLISQIKLNNFLLEELSSEDPVKKDVFFFEDHFSGVRPFEMELIIPEGKELWSSELANDFNRIEQYLDTVYEVGNIVSPLSLVKGANQIDRGGKSRYYRFPKSEQQLEKILKQIEKNIDRPEIAEKVKLYKTDDAIRVSGKIPDLGAIAIAEKNQLFLVEMNRFGLKDKYQLKITGTADLIDKNNKHLSKTMMYGLFVAFGVIGLIMAIMFKNVYLLIVSWLVNLVPLMLIAALMGLLGINLKISTSLIFTVSFGIAVDDTIHFLSRYRGELKAGRSNLYALKRTFISTGKAIILTSIMLCAGFLTLLLSDFGGTYFIGLLVTYTLVFAVLIDLTLLPVLLLYRKKKV